jgi:hypothetical protein
MAEMPPIFIPGDPRTTSYVKKLSTIAGLLQRDTVMYVTSGDWTRLTRELDAQYSDCLMDPTRPAPWNTGSEFVIHQMGDCRLTVVNAGTESQLDVNKKNQDTPGAIDFIETRDRMRVG